MSRKMSQRRRVARRQRAEEDECPSHPPMKDLSLVSSLVGKDDTNIMNFLKLFIR